MNPAEENNTLYLKKNEKKNINYPSPPLSTWNTTQEINIYYPGAEKEKIYPRNIGKINFNSGQIWPDNEFQETQL